MKEIIKTIAVGGCVVSVIIISIFAYANYKSNKSVTRSTPVTWSSNLTIEVSNILKDNKIEGCEFAEYKPTGNNQFVVRCETMDNWTMYIVDGNSNSIKKSVASKRKVIPVKIFTEDDFGWDKKTKPYKKMIVSWVNKIHKENPSCKDIDTWSASMSSTKGTKSNPVFFVACGKGRNIHNVFFSKSDITANKMRAAPHPVRKDKAINICRNAIMSGANFPNTVNILTSTISVDAGANANTRVDIGFYAENGLRSSHRYNANCLILPNGKLDTFNIQGG